MQLKQEQRIKIDVYLREGKTITEISENFRLFLSNNTKRNK